MHRLRTQLLVFVMLSMNYVSLHSMLSVENNQDVVWDMITAYSLSCHDYKTYRNVAMLNKQCNKIIEDTYRSQKKRIENFIQSKSTSVTGHRSWNKDFTRCAWVTYDGDSSAPKDLRFTLVGVVTNNQITMQSAAWEEFYCPVFEDDVRPFFDKDGKGCFYGCGIGLANSEISKVVLEYCIDLDGESKKFHCLYYVPNPTEWADDYECFVPLLNFPLLVKALLQSTDIRYQRNYKQYYARWATWSEDWMTFKQHVAFKHIENEEGVPEDQSSLYKTCDSFSESLQSVIGELMWRKAIKNAHTNLEEK